MGYVPVDAEPDLANFPLKGARDPTEDGKSHAVEHQCAGREEANEVRMPSGEGEQGSGCVNMHEKQSGALAAGGGVMEGQRLGIVPCRGRSCDILCFYKRGSTRVRSVPPQETVGSHRCPARAFEISASPSYEILIAAG